MWNAKRVVDGCIKGYVSNGNVAVNPLGYLVNHFIIIIHKKVHTNRSLLGIEKSCICVINWVKVDIKDRDLTQWWAYN